MDELELKRMIQQKALEFYIEKLEHDAPPWKGSHIGSSFYSSPEKVSSVMLTPIPRYCTMQGLSYMGLRKGPGRAPKGQVSARVQALVKLSGKRTSGPQPLESHMTPKGQSTAGSLWQISQVPGQRNAPSR